MTDLHTKKLWEWYGQKIYNMTMYEAESLFIVFQFRRDRV